MNFKNQIQESVKLIFTKTRIFFIFQDKPNENIRSKVFYSSKDISELKEIIKNDFVLLKNEMNLSDKTLVYIRKETFYNCDFEITTTGLWLKDHNCFLSIWDMINSNAFIEFLRKDINKISKKTISEVRKLMEENKNKTPEYNKIRIINFLNILNYLEAKIG